MLTQSEKRWLKKRKEWSVCSYCSNIPQTMCLYGERPHFCALLDVDYKDAAEFSERVAAKLAADENCGVDEDCPPDMPFGWGRLKSARLAVEEEMDEAD